MSQRAIFPAVDNIASLQELRVLKENCKAETVKWQETVNGGITFWIQKHQKTTFIFNFFPTFYFSSAGYILLSHKVKSEPSSGRGDLTGENLLSATSPAVWVEGRFSTRPCFCRGGLFPFCLRRVAWLKDRRPFLSASCCKPPWGLKSPCSHGFKATVSNTCTEWHASSIKWLSGKSKRSNASDVYYR